jgi:hypothetical protein
MCSEQVPCIHKHVPTSVRVVYGSPGRIDCKEMIAPPELASDPCLDGTQS